MSEKALDKSKCINGSYGWVIVLFTMLVGFVPGSNMAKAIALAPVVCQNFMIDNATFGLVVAAFYIMGFVMAFPTTGLVNKWGSVGCRRRWLRRRWLHHGCNGRNEHDAVHREPRCRGCFVRYHGRCRRFVDRPVVLS